MLSFAATSIYVLALAAAATSDLVRYQIPNGLSIALILAFVLLAVSLPLPAIVDHLLAGVTVFGLMSLLFVAGVCGGGDVKLLGATALWMGWANLPAFLLLTALAGGGLALILLVARRLARGETAATGARLRRLFAKDAGVPYGVAIAIAGLVMIPQLAPATLSPAGLN